MADSWTLCADWGRVGVTKESVIHTLFGVFHKEINLIKFQKSARLIFKLPIGIKT
jgi:hypothetical protein